VGPKHYTGIFGEGDKISVSGIDPWFLGLQSVA
jgi:hypothetical protein